MSTLMNGPLGNLNEDSSSGTSTAPVPVVTGTRDITPIVEQRMANKLHRAGACIGI